MKEMNPETMEKIIESLENNEAVQRMTAEMLKEAERYGVPEEVRQASRQMIVYAALANGLVPEVCETMGKAVWEHFNS